MKIPKGWKKIKESKKDGVEFENMFNHTRVNVFKSIAENHWAVSVLRVGESYKNIAGGKSKVQPTNKQKAMKIATNWMKKHPKG